MLFPKIIKTYCVKDVADVMDVVCDTNNLLTKKIKWLCIAGICLDLAMISYKIDTDIKMRKMQDEIDELKAKEHTPQED